MRFVTMIVISILLVPSLLTTVTTTPTVAHAAEKTLEKPKLKIDKKGKVNIMESDGKVKTKQSLLTTFIKKYRVIIAGISGVGAVSMILFFIIGFIKLGATGSNPEARSQVIMGLVGSGLAAAGLGSVAFVTGVFFNAL